MGKVDLQSRVDALLGETSFLKYLFETVSLSHMSNPSIFCDLNMG